MYPPSPPKKSDLAAPNSENQSSPVSLFQVGILLFKVLKFLFMVAHHVQGRTTAIKLGYLPSAVSCVVGGSGKLGTCCVILFSSYLRASKPRSWEASVLLTWSR